MNYQKIKGTADLFPQETYKWQYVEQTARQIMKKYRFEEIRTPIFEALELFARGVGETSDIVSKEMYDFYDKGDRHLALRPEGTAGATRAYVENKMYAPEYHKPQKYYYIGPMFRYERPQSGRMRQFHQLGVEVFGSKNPAIDVETISLAMELFETIGLSQLKLVINSLGSNESRKEYRQALIEYLEPHYDDLSEDSKERLYKNPLRVLDSKDPKDKELVKGAPSILDYLDEDSQKYFDQVKDQLDLLGISYEIDTNMVRGLDYYNDTIFEIMTIDSNFGSNTTIAAGGRYDSLVEEVGGPYTPAFGFAFGLERLIMLIENEQVNIPQGENLDIFIVTIGEQADKEATKIVHVLRQHDLIVEREYMNRKPGKQFKTANNLKARVVLTLGDSEIESGTITAKLLSSGQQKEINIEEIYADDFNQTFKQLIEELA